ncbi:hypothetical protein ADEAN_000012000 [Angomonas deanei]|uniref:LysM domain containing protein n=1 Tax=Angomonas deanei TaxID=59799 RepID=A0A7G2BYW9_9TRYP|nr:hypothetical protein ADEAN_000012000 [Angomonas deanei]
MSAVSSEVAFLKETLNTIEATSPRCELTLSETNRLLIQLAYTTALLRRTYAQSNTQADSLADVSARLGVSVAALRQLNPMLASIGDTEPLPENTYLKVPPRVLEEPRAELGKEVKGRPSEPKSETPTRGAAPKEREKSISVNTTPPAAVSSARSPIAVKSPPSKPSSLADKGSELSPRSPSTSSASQAMVVVRTRSNSTSTAALVPPPELASPSLPRTSGVSSPASAVKSVTEREITPPEQVKSSQISLEVEEPTPSSDVPPSIGKFASAPPPTLSRRGTPPQPYKERTLTPNLNPNSNIKLRHLMQPKSSPRGSPLASAPQPEVVSPVSEREDSSPKSVPIDLPVGAVASTSPPSAARSPPREQRVPSEDTVSEATVNEVSPPSENSLKRAEPDFESEEETDEGEEFDTIQGICETYSVKIDDVLSFNPFLKEYKIDEPLPPDLPIVLPLPQDS